MIPTIKIPVYSARLGIGRLEIYRQTEAGDFVRTTEQPFRKLQDSIAGVGERFGELRSPRADRVEREWATPTVVARGGQPQSYFEFLRGQLERRRLVVFSPPELSGRIFHFGVHELRLTASVSRQVLALFTRKYHEELALLTQQAVEEQRAAYGHVVNG